MFVSLQQSDEFGISGTLLFPSTVTVKAEVGINVKSEEEMGNVAEAVTGKGVTVAQEQAGPSSRAIEQEVQE